MTFKPRPARVRLSPLHRLNFLRKNTGRKSTFSLGNISKQGMGLIRESDAVDVGDRLEGELKINDRRFEIGAEVKQATTSTYGCEFVSGALSEVEAAVASYFAVEICAVNLKKIDPKHLKTDALGDVHWYTDGGTNEIYAVIGKGGVENFHLTFLGNYIEGGSRRPLKAGYVIDEFDAEDGVHKRAALLDLAASVESEVLFLGTQLIENTDEMPEEQRELLLQLLKG